MTEFESPNHKRSWRIVAGGAVALSLAIVGVLLRPGTLLLLDSPLYLNGPRPRLSPSFWGFPPAPTNLAPVEAFFLGLFKLVPFGQTRLIFYLALPPLAACGFARLFKRDPLPTLAATFLYVVNPFMYERMLAGHLYFVVGFALLPLLLSCLLDVRFPRSAAVKIGLLLATLAALSLHFIFVAGLLVVAVVGAALAYKRFGTARVCAMGLVAAGALCLYWLIPLFFASVPVAQVGELDQELFRTAADFRFGLIANVLGLQGFWGTRWPLPKTTVGWPQLLAAILLIAGIGFVDMVRDHSRRVMVLALGLAGLFGMLLALGDQGPTGSIFLWMLRTIPGFGAMREPQKFLGLLALAYAVGFGWGVKVLVAQARTRRWMAMVLVILLAVPAVYGFRGFGGFVGYAAPSRYPESWAKADRVLGDGPEKVLALPWHLYIGTPWAQGRVVANPMASYFRRDTIVSQDPEYGSLQAGGPDGRDGYIASAIRDSAKERHLGRLIAPLGVKYVLLAHMFSVNKYDWVYRQKDLRVLRQWSDLTLFENTATVRAAYVPSSKKTSIAVEQESPVSVRVRGTADHGPLVTTIPFSSGWEYQGVRAQRSRGVLASFPVGRVTPGSIRYAPWAIVRLGYVVGASLLILALAFLILERRRFQSGESPSDLKLN